MRRIARDRRWRWWVGGLVLFLVALRLALDPLATELTRRKLASLPGYRVEFRDVSVSLLHLSYTIRDLVVSDRKEGKGEPLFKAEEIEAGVYGRRLLRGHVVGAIRLEKPKLSLHAAQKQHEEAPQLSQTLEKLAPFRLDRVEVRKGEVLFVDNAGPRPARLWLHGVEATVENVASRAALAEGQPTVIALSGTLQQHGEVSFFASADPFAKKSTFAGQGAVRGLPVEELGEFLVSRTDTTPRSGTLDLSMRFEARDGHITGGVRPVAKHVRVSPAKDDFGSRLKAALVDVGLKILSDRVPGRDAFATTIPIDGSVSAPGADVWATLWGVVRNAFVAGVINGATGLPPGGGKGEPQARTPGKRG